MRLTAEIIKKKYNGKNILITGNSQIKITKVLKEVAKITKINKKPIFRILKMKVTTILVPIITHQLKIQK